MFNESSEAEEATKPAANLKACLKVDALAEIERLCATLPRTHFASVFGERLGRIRALAGSVPFELASLGASVEAAGGAGVSSESI